MVHVRPKVLICYNTMILVVVLALSLRKAQFGPGDHTYRASTYVELLLNDHALPCNIKVTQAKVSNLSQVMHCRDRAFPI